MLSHNVLPPEDPNLIEKVMSASIQKMQSVEMINSEESGKLGILRKSKQSKSYRVSAAKMIDFNAFLKNREERKEADEDFCSEILDNELLDIHGVGDKM